MKFIRLASRISSPRSSLRRLLYRGHLGVALAAVCMAGLAVTVVGLLTLRAYAEHNLHLIGRSMAYTAEAAVVFSDGPAADEALRLIASSEEVSRASILDRSGHVLASWQRPGDSAISGIERRVGQWLLGEESSHPIVHDGATVGQVRLSGSGGRLLMFLIAGTGGMLACLLLTSLGALYLSRRQVDRIIGPLDQLADVAHTVRRNREFFHRVPAARIAELDELGEDFNALLDELESWQTHLEIENASLVHQANHDSLTRLPNRAFFEGRLSRALRDVANHGENAAVLFIDTDHFKSINDELGHAAGDCVLVNIAERISGQLRENDLVARIGGDEFAVLLAPLASDDIALRIADDIIASMTIPIALPDDGSVRVSLTIGIALYPQHGLTPEALLHSADIAMYEAKRQARGVRRMAGSTENQSIAEKQETSDAVEPFSS